MREILFRGKRLDNGVWIEGSLIKATAENIPHYLIFEDKFSFDRKTVTALSHAAVIPETVGEFTGQYDKRGRKIFEGDIVEIDEIFGIKRKAYEIKYILGQFFVGINMPIAYKQFDCVVIGNTHDNPELLKGES